MGLLTADVQNPMPNIGDYFITRSLERLFCSTTQVRVPLHVPPTAVTLESLRDCDVVLLCGTNIVGSNGTVRSSFEIPHFSAIGRPIIPVGLGSQADLDRTPSIDQRGAELLRFWFQSSGPLSVRDPLTLEVVEGVLGKGRARYTGCPSVTLSALAFTSRKELSLFCPAPYHYLPPGFSERQYRTLVSKIFKLGGGVWMAQQPSDLLYDGTPLGVRTLYSPRYPEHHLQALASARELLTFRIHPALLAVTQGTPAVVIAIDERVRSLAKSMGIPTVDVTSPCSANEILRQARRQFDSYPWAEIRSRLQYVQRAVKEHLVSKDLPVDDAPISVTTPLPIACISDGRYLPRLTGLLHNLLAVQSGMIELHLLVLDQEAAQFRFEDPRVTLRKITLEDIWPARSSRIAATPPAIRAYASKAALLRYVVEHTGRRVLFLDVDLFFFHSPAPLVEKITPADPVLLFPHWHDEPSHAARYGIFNSGMVGAHPEAVPFLEWWTERCFEHCSPLDGNFYEQSYLDRSLLSFPFVRVYPHKDHNVAFWNLTRTKAEIPRTEPWAPRCDAGVRLASFHAARPDGLGIFEVKYAQDQFSTLFSPIRSKLEEPEYAIESLVQKRAYWPFAKRVSYLYDGLRARLKLSDEITQRILSCLLCAAGRDGLSILAWGYRWWRDLRKKKERESRVLPTLPPIIRQLLERDAAPLGLSKEPV